MGRGTQLPPGVLRGSPQQQARGPSEGAGPWVSSPAACPCLRQSLLLRSFTPRCPLRPHAKPHPPGVHRSFRQDGVGVQQLPRGKSDALEARGQALALMLRVTLHTPFSPRGPSSGHSELPKPTPRQKPATLCPAWPSTRCGIPGTRSTSLGLCLLSEKKRLE